ncbi:MAG TPA: sugar-transfer associated ATP-grasp domain-containing protein [Dongiaceae bacterium]|nr:sugar-transfer associated ATP-grasp domain-containing protein [Dongiaceae bacterium]
MLFQRSAQSSSSWPSPSLAGPQSPSAQDARKEAGETAGEEALGRRARHLFDRYIRHRRHEPDLQLLYLPGMPTVLDIGRCLYWWGLTSGRIERECGVSRWRQLREAWAFTWQERIQAQLYYMYELYRPQEQARMGAYLTRRETKNGLLRAINWMTRNGQGKQTDFGDKATFIALLRRHALPTTAVLFSCDRQHADLTLSPAAAFECDLFVKDRYGKGAQGAKLIRHIGPGRFEYGNQQVSLAQLVTGLTEQSEETPLIVVARLFNHPDLADLAEQSLITLRVFTCLDEAGQPAVVMAMLRILGKLESNWRTEIEWGSAIDPETGQLGLLVSDIPHQDNGRYTHHPVTGRRITGRIVPFWSEIRRVAEAGHQIARDRLLIGWDIAVTPAGPVILEANGIPDFVFPQRVHRLPIGETRFGRLMTPHLDRLEQSIDRLPADQRKASRGK